MILQRKDRRKAFLARSYSESGTSMASELAWETKAGEEGMDDARSCGGCASDGSSLGRDSGSSSSPESLAEAKLSATKRTHCHG